MRRKLVVLLTLGVGLVSLLATALDVGDAEAQRGRRGRRQRGGAAAAEAPPPNSDAIAGALGDLRWGMEPRQVHEYFVTKIRERYRIRLAKAPGTIEEDRIRAEMDTEIRRLRESYVRFDGARTGWDLSFLRTEFTHGNRESMLVYRDENSQNFYFFIGGRLWKWFKAFDASVFQGQSFDQFAQAVQGRFGRAAERSGRLVADGPEQHWLEWQDQGTRLRAVDQTRFYGFYCLVFEDRGTLGRLAQLRTNTIQTGNQGGHALVESVTLPEGGEATSDDGHADIVDRLTGQVRRRPEAPAGGQGAQRGGSGSSGSGSSGSSPSPGGSSGSTGSSSGSGSGQGRSLTLDDL